VSWDYRAYIDLCQYSYCWDRVGIIVMSCPKLNTDVIFFTVIQVG